MNVTLQWDTSINCEFCEALFDNQDALKQHLKLHSRRKPYKCDECDARFSYNSTLEWHKRSHCGEMPFKCDECSAQFAQNSMLIWHKRKHSMAGTSQNPTIVVNMTSLYQQQNFSNVFGVPGIITTSATPGASTVAVPVSVNESVSDITQAEMQMHSCSSGIEHSVVMTASSPSAMVTSQHDKQKQNVEEVFHCGICSTAFSSSTDLKGHMNTKHNMGENNPFLILYKQQQMDSSRKIKRKIIQEKPFKCDLCYAGFNTEGHLKNHRQTHITERPYKCVKCGLCFSDKLILESHERRHQAERPFKCNRCGASFFRDSHLQKHIKRHVGEML